MRASIWLVALGLTLAIISGMVSVAEGTYAADRGTPATHFAPAIMVIAGALFIVGVLVEIFQIGTAIRKLAAKT